MPIKCHDKTIKYDNETNNLLIKGVGMLFIGIDGGGTKTEFLLCNEKGKELGTVKLGCANIWQYDEQTVTEVLVDGLNKILASTGISPEQVSGVGFGAACFGESKEKDDLYKRICNKVFGNVLVEIKSDVEIALIASLGYQSGINIVCGTGSMAFGMDDHDKVERCGGWGHQIGDEGSGHWLGRKALELFTKQSDGRIEKTILYKLVKEKLNLENDFDLITMADNLLYASRTDTAAIQKILFEAAKLNDKYAIQAYEEAANEIVMLANALRNKLDFEDTVKVSYSGGVFQARDFLKKPLIRNLNKLGFKVVEPKYSPVQGAAFLAAKQFDMHNQLMESIDKNNEEKIGGSFEKSNI